MAFAWAIDAGADGAHHEGEVSSGILERAYAGCRERLGPLGVTQAWFAREVAEVLGEAPPEALERKIVLDDLYLALGCRTGSNAAWRAFDRAYRGYLLRLATRYTGARGQAEDLITDLYHDLVTRPGREGKLEHYRGYAALSTWLAVIVRRMAMDRGRSLERSGQRMVRLRGEIEAAPGLPTPESSLEGKQARAAAAVLFSEAFGSLEGPHALVLSLLYRDGMTLREAGQVMRLDFSTVSRRAKVARGALREALERLADERLGLPAEELAGLFDAGGDAAAFASSEAEA